MKITRRKFLDAVPAVAAAIIGLNRLGLGQNLVGMPVAAKPSVPAALFSWDTFLPYIGTDFTFRDPRERQMTLTLVDMSESGGSPGRLSKGTPECFTMTFMGPISQRFIQLTYDVEHFALGSFELFITEAGKKKQNGIFVAVINHTLS